MTKTKRLALLALLLCTGVFISCKEEFLNETSKYDRPEWLAGKVYTQLKSLPELSMFATCVELVGYDSIIDVSGSYTVFAPNDEAFTTYLQNHPMYNSIEDIPIAQLTELVKYHIVQNPWSKDQLRSLDVYGWIDSLDLNNNKPRGFKRETLLRKQDRKFGVKGTFTNNHIVDTTETNWHRRVITDSRKFAPVFFEKYFSIYDLKGEDYEFYFDRPFESGDAIYYSGGKIIGDEIFAENGFVYNIDRVIEPLKNGYELLSSKSGNNTYSKFLELVNLFPQFTYNQQETFDQPGADQGLKVDSLFDLTYPELAFDITNEETKPPSGNLGLPGNVTIRYHHGMVVPTDEAFDQFVNDYLVGPNRWGGIEGAPRHIRRIIANTHMSVNPIYPTDFVNGFYNGERDIVTVNEANVVHKEYGSNCTFVGVNKAIVPRAFSSVTGPIYLQPGYSRAMYAIEKSGLLSALKRRNQNYSLFVESDMNLSADSSLLYDPIEEEFTLFQGSGLEARQLPVTINDLRTLILNHIGISTPTGQAKKEFVKNLAGNYIVFDNETGIVSGTAPTSIGYKGNFFAPNYPTQISTNADNGITYDIDNWFDFTSGNIYNIIKGAYPQFHNLMRKAGYDRDKEFRYSFISDNEFYTVFIPTDQAITEAGADTLEGKALQDFVLMHFIQGEMVFTDGRKSHGYYETVRTSDQSTEFTTLFTKVYLKPGFDVIEIPGNDGSNYITVNESENTNVVTARTIQTEGDGQPTYPNLVSQAVIHEIDKVFSLEEMDTE